MLARINAEDIQATRRHIKRVSRNIPIPETIITAHQRKIEAFLTLPQRLFLLPAAMQLETHREKQQSTSNHHESNTFGSLQPLLSAVVQAQKPEHIITEKYPQRGHKHVLESDKSCTGRGANRGIQSVFLKHLATIAGGV